MGHLFSNILFKSTRNLYLDIAFSLEWKFNIVYNLFITIIYYLKKK